MLIKFKVNVARPSPLGHRFLLISITSIFTFNAADQIMVEILKIKDFSNSRRLFTEMVISRISIKSKVSRA